MADLRLSRAAADDLDHIALDGAERYGADAAADYVASFGTIFALLKDYREAGRPREGIRPGLRSRGHRSHVVYYDIEGQTVVVVRVLRGALDTRAALG